jgi:hypothetical protein
METPTVNEKSPSNRERQHGTPSSLVEKSINAEEADTKPTTSDITSHDPNIVGFDGTDDPEDPQNWSNRYKYVLVGLLSAMQTMV